jgi:hypothetical protein
VSFDAAAPVQAWFDEIKDFNSDNVDSFNSA